jgi:sRNA-binding regulator protein Hfq
MGSNCKARLYPFDLYGLILKRSSQQFVYKHAISTIVPLREFNIAQHSAKTEPAHDIPADAHHESEP